VNFEASEMAARFSVSERVVRASAINPLKIVRCLHRWVGLVATLPCILVAGTGLLLVHPGWYQPPKHRDLPAEPVHPAAAGSALQTTLQMAYSESSGFRLKQVDIRYDRKKGWMVLVKGHLSESSPEKQFVQAIAPRLPPTTELGRKVENVEALANLDVKKTVNDLHTGKIFGTYAAWIWADGLAGVLIFLAATGVILSFPTLFCRRQKAGLSPESQPNTEDGS